MEKFLDKLVILSSKFAQNKVLNVIQSSFMLLMPVTMLGGFAALFNGLGIDAYQAFITSTGIKGILSVIYQWTIGMFGVYVSFLVALQFARNFRFAKSDIAVALTSLVCFLIVTPYTVPEDPYGAAQLPVSWLGSQGMFTAIIIAFAVGVIFMFCEKNNIVIKNTGNTKAFIRATIIGNWCADNGEAVFGYTDFLDPDSPYVEIPSWTIDNPGGGKFSGLPGEGWVRAKDGYFYYTTALESGATAPALFTSYTPGEAPKYQIAGKNIDAHFVMEIATQAITTNKIDGTGSYETWSAAWKEALGYVPSTN